MLRHPEQAGLELVSHLGRVNRGDDHIPATDIDLIGQCQGNCFADPGTTQMPLPDHDLLDPARNPGREYPHRITRPHLPLCHPTAKTAEIRIGAIDPLHRHAEGRAGLGNIRLY